jgi:hypothetical protein
MQSCQASRRDALEQARRYFEVDLPQRRQSELNTLMRFTGWSAEQAQRFAGVDPASGELPGPNGATPLLWWQKLFGTGNGNVDKAAAR